MNVCKNCTKHMRTLSKTELESERSSRLKSYADKYVDYIFDPTTFQHKGHWDANEVWRPIPNYEGYYEASDFGRIRSLWLRNVWRVVPLVLTVYTNDDGYQGITLVKSSKHVNEHVHRLVLLSFAGSPPEDKPLAGHRDGNPSNNYLSNLRWIDHVQNEADKRMHGRMLLGSINHQSKLDDSSVAQIRALSRADVKGTTLAAQFSVSTAVISKIIRHESWKHVE